jgi:hypothetical protein
MYTGGLKVYNCVLCSLLIFIFKTVIPHIHRVSMIKVELQVGYSSYVFGYFTFSLNSAQATALIQPIQNFLPHMANNFES